jgi:DNA-binding CsgD family transcriptional regulator/tetratricopeptide (TPR) repeat protein
VPSGDTAPLVGRADLLDAIDTRLTAGTSAVLSGPDGIGKTALLDAVAAAAAARGELVLRVAATEADRFLPYAVLADLMRQVPAAAVAALPAPQRAAVDAVLLRRADARGRGGRAELARRLAWIGLLDWCASGSRAGNTAVLLVLDDAQWFDAASAEVIGYAHRRLGTPAVRAIAAQRWPTGDSGATGGDAGGDATADGATGGDHRATPRPSVSRLCPAPVVELTVPPLPAGDLADLLEAYGLPCRAASQLHAESGGNPYLALALGGAFGHRPAALGRPLALPEHVRARLRRQLTAQPAPVRETLFVAALATRPTVPLLRRAGRPDAERELRAAQSAGLVDLDAEVVRFTPAALATVLADDADPQRCVAVHSALAAAAADPAERARHGAMASAHPDADVARSLVSAAEAARRYGARGLTADLYLLAADRTPGDGHGDRLDRLVAAAEAAAAAGRADLVGRAADAVLATDAPAAHRVRVRLAMIDLAGQALAEMDEVFMAALADADGDPALLAPLRLRLAWQAMVQGEPERARDDAAKAIAHAEAAGDPATAAMALSVHAQLQRAAGDPTYTATLSRALDLPEPPLAGWLHLTPRYLAARFAFFDDRLDEARAQLLRLLADAERGGGEKVVGVLRSLAEVAARAGRCAEALDYAGRATRAAEESGLSPGPGWYTAAVAELAGGSLARAIGYARRGVRASEQERDAIYLCRSLHALGQARLRTGDIRGGVEALRRLRTVEAHHRMGDPSVLRWHSDLAAGLAMLGAYAEATDTIAGARRAAAAIGRSPAVVACLDRSAAMVESQRGDAEAAVPLATAAARRFAELRQPIEQGHTLLVLGQAERRRRRYAAARAAVAAALALFTEVGAAPWVEQATRALTPGGAGGGMTAGVTSEAIAGAPAGPGRPHPAATLTSTEARIAALVGEGATNRDIAAGLYLSVKTVEATLTRIYRKLGVRSRTQLSSLLNRP